MPHFITTHSINNPNYIKMQQNKNQQLDAKFRKFIKVLIKLIIAKKELENRCPCSEDTIKETTHLQIQASDYNNIPYNTDDSMESIIAKFIRLNRIPEACKYYMDETGLNDTDAIEFVVDTYKKIDQIDKDAFERLLNKLRVLKNKGFIEQAINEYQKFTLSEKNAAETFINDL